MFTLGSLTALPAAFLRGGFANTLGS